MSDQTSRALAATILGLVMKHRRNAAHSACKGGDCVDSCLAPHLQRIEKSITAGETVTFVLPAFPGKSPNPGKVLGPMPDMAERQSLAFLNDLCLRIGAVYSPGARIVLCSDGRVFSDVVGMKESDVSAYQREISAMISALGASALSTFNLDDVFPDCGFDTMRERLMAAHSMPLAELRAAVRAGGEAQRMYCGITRFLVEDATLPGMQISRTALQKSCRERAYQVVRRSKAWDGLLATIFPDAVRLSIHPQSCGSRKIGIHMMATSDGWLTPWHGVAALVNGNFVLLKRRDAEAAGADVVFRNGRPSHYVMPTAQSVGVTAAAEDREHSLMEHAN